MIRHGSDAIRKSAGRNGRARTGSRTSAAEAIYTALGIALACGAVAFAYVEVRDNDGTPKVFGGSHLALFAQPSHRNATAPSQEAAESSPTSTGMVGPDANVDYSTTASIPRDGRWDVFGTREERAANDGAAREKAAQGGAREIVVAPGERMPAGGVIRAIVLRDGRWVAIVAAEPGAHNSR